MTKQSVRIAITVLVAAFLVTTMGCSKKPAEALVGKWAVDVDSLAEMDEFKNMPEEERKAALEMAKGFMSSMSVEFTADKAIMEMMGKKEEASYTVKSSEGDKLVIEMVETKDGKEEKREVTVEMKGSDKVVLHMGEKEKFPLKRK